MDRIFENDDVRDFILECFTSSFLKTIHYCILFIIIYNATEPYFYESEESQVYYSKIHQELNVFKIKIINLFSTVNIGKLPMSVNAFEDFKREFVTFIVEDPIFIESIDKISNSLIDIGLELPPSFECIFKQIFIEKIDDDEEIKDVLILYDTNDDEVLNGNNINVETYDVNEQNYALNNL